MRLSRLVVPWALVALLTACSQTAEPGVQTSGVIVVTEGAAAPSSAGPELAPQANLQFVDIKLDGSATQTIELCPASEVDIEIYFRTTGQQSGVATFGVKPVHTWDGTMWTTDPADGLVTAQVPEGTGNRAFGPLPVKLVHDGTQVTGTTVLTITPEIPVQGAGNQPLVLSSSPTVTVVFAECGGEEPPANRAPTITAKAQNLYVEAAGPLTAVFDDVEDNIVATDPDDDPISLTFTYGSSDPEELDLNEGTELGLGEYQVKVVASDGQDTDFVVFALIVQDTTPPDLSGAPASPLIADDITGTMLDMGDLSATDLVDPDPTIVCAPTALPIGANRVSCYAEDFSGNPSDAQEFDVLVTFANIGGGFLSPFKNDEIKAKAGSTIPFKFDAPSYGGGLATDLASGLKFVLTPVGTATDIGVDADTFESYATGSTAWRYEPRDEHYIFNLKTVKGWTGSYVATVSFQGVVLAEGTVHFR